MGEHNDEASDFVTKNFFWSSSLNVWARIEIRTIESRRDPPPSGKDCAPRAKIVP